MEISKAAAALALAAAIYAAVPAEALAPQSVQVGRSSAVTRAVTPNGDGRNDTFLFKCYNPRDSEVRGLVFDLGGRKVGEMRLRSVSGTDYFYVMEWDPAGYPGGLYVYQVTVEDKSYRGTVLVVR